MTFLQLNFRDDPLPGEVTSPSTTDYSIEQLRTFLSQNYPYFNAVLQKPPLTPQLFSNTFTTNTTSTSTNPYVAICLFDWNTMTSKFGNPQLQRKIYLTSASAATITGWLPGPQDVFGNTTFIHVSILTSDLASITCP